MSPCSRRARPAAPFAASAGSSRVLRFEYGPDAHYTELVLRAREQWRELERLLGETLYEETGVLWFAVEESRYLQDSRRDEPGRRPSGAPARARRGRAAVPGILVRGHRGRAARRGGRGAARAPRDARPGAAGARRGRDLREGVAVRAVGDGVVELADGSSERADQVLVDHRRLDAAGSLPAAPIRSTQQVNAYLRVRTAGLPVWIYDLDVYGLGDDGGAGLKVGGHAIGADVDPDDPGGARGAGGGGAAPRRRGAPAPTGPAVARRRAARARRRRLLLRADAHRGADRRPARRAHRRVRRLLRPRLQVRARGRGRRRGSRARPPARGRPGAVPLARRIENVLLRRSRRASPGAAARRRARSTTAGA